MAETTLPLEDGKTSSKPKAVSSSDKHIWGIFIALCIISTIELYSASSREVASSSLGVMGPIIRHLVMLAGGTLIVWYLSRRHYSDFIPFTLGFSLISVALMLYVMFFGDVINDARRSFTFLGIGIFPAEMVKISAVLLIALVMTWNPDTKKVGVTSNAVVYSGAIVLILSGLLIKQGLTNTLLLIAISYSMMIVGGVKIKHLLQLTAVYIAIGSVFILTTDAGRLETWLARWHRFFTTEVKADDGTMKTVEPWEVEPTGKNRQSVLSFMAQANGGIHGVGPGNSREASRLPLAFSDYIYAIIIEELGLIGGIVVLVLYLWLLGRAAGIASRCTRTYPALAVIGMAVMIAFQALFHMAIVSGVFPVSGQPLPLISKGGTSIVVTAIAFGIMLSISRTATRQGGKKQDIREEFEALPEQFGGENSMQL